MVVSPTGGSNSAGRVRPCQGRCRRFESGLPLHFFLAKQTKRPLSEGLSGRPTAIRSTEGLMTPLFQNIRYGFRMLVRNPSFTAVAVLCLVLGLPRVLNRFGEPVQHCAPQNGDCHEFPAPFAGNSLAVPGLPNGIGPVSARFPKAVKHPESPLLPSAIASGNLDGCSQN